MLSDISPARHSASGVALFVGAGRALDPGRNRSFLGQRWPMVSGDHGAALYRGTRLRIPGDTPLHPAGQRQYVSVTGLLRRARNLHGGLDVSVASDLSFLREAR